MIVVVVVVAVIILSRNKEKVAATAWELTKAVPGCKVHQIHCDLG
jgi:short-subunit dehydrogenase